MHSYAQGYLPTLQSFQPELLQRLREDGYDGFFSLEPHLSAAGQYGGFSGPDLFRRASQALQQMLRTMNWAYNEKPTKY